MPTLTTQISELARLNKKTISGLKSLGVTTVGDLLFYFPFRYLDFSKFTKLSEIKSGETITIRGTIKTITSRYSFRGRMGLAEGIISDDTSSIKVVWFNQSWVAKTLKQGDEVFLSGKPEVYKGVLQLSNPIYELVSDDSIHTGRLVPVYRLTEGLYNKTLQRLVKTVLPVAQQIIDDVPINIINQFNLLKLPSAIEELHFPTSEEQLTKAKTRIIFDEVFIQQLAVLVHKKQLAELPAPSIAPNIALIKELLATLPFTLTDDQKRALWQIVQDMETKHPMNRLLQGDVGSGKTMVAFVAGTETVYDDFQVAFLAPTEILAKQHYESFITAGFGKNKFSVGLLTNHFHIVDGNDMTRPAMLKIIGAGKVQFIFGTHALIAEKVAFKNLGLVIVDEQHRFGVQQRADILKKNSRSAAVPHLLSMTATPIPRTLALSVYGDLEISTLRELPQGRKTVMTKIVNEAERGQIYELIRKQINEGRQVFVITPLVEESEKLTTKSVKLEYERLQKEVFPKFKLSLLYGSMKGSQKDVAMKEFNEGKSNILVATSVVEIGIDVPNATVILIEGAERFGLAQLHQLRGRVGRGQHQSYCLLFTESTDEKTLARLKTFISTSDGFKLAELDLEQRGFGSLFGQQQSGYNFKFSQYLTLKTLELGKKAALELLKTDPELSNIPGILAKISPLLNSIHLE